MNESRTEKIDMSPGEALARFERAYGPFAHETEPRCGAADPSDPGRTCGRAPHMLTFFGQTTSVGSHASRSFAPDGRAFELRAWHSTIDLTPWGMNLRIGPGA